jgi:stearoyl-CoA desaturase (delta-9 desaturase)
MIWTSITNQGTIYHWARDHIVHHKYSDTTADPHNINNGFFFAHVGWLLYEKHSDVIQAGKAINDKYLLDDPVVTFQKQNAWWWMPLWCYLFPTMYGIVFLHMPAVDAFCILAVLRWVLSMHATWCVNSVAHTFGYKPYDTDMKPTENTFTNIVAVGEGSHNWHHKYPNDYAASEYDMLTTGKVFNPSKCIIDLMYCCGQVYDLKRFDYVNKKWLLFN